MAMRSIIIALLLALTAFAQEMDTTFFANEQGETFGIIHEKGTLPEIPQQQQMNELQSQDQAVQQQMQVAPIQQANPVLGYDSTDYYRGMIQQYKESGNRIRRYGKLMMILSGVEAGIGVGLSVAGTDEGPCSIYTFGDENCLLVTTGVITMATGTLFFAVGTIVKIIGGIELGRARRYEDGLQKYQAKQRYSVKLRFDPLIDPINKMAGINLAMEF